MLLRRRWSTSTSLTRTATASLRMRAFLTRPMTRMRACVCVLVCVSVCMCVYMYMCVLVRAFCICVFVSVSHSLIQLLNSPTSSIFSLLFSPTFLPLSFVLSLSTPFFTSFSLPPLSHLRSHSGRPFHWGKKTWYWHIWHSVTCFPPSIWTCRRAGSSHGSCVGLLETSDGRRVWQMGLPHRWSTHGGKDLRTWECKRACAHVCVCACVWRR